MNNLPVLDRLENKYNESTPAWRDTETGIMIKDAIEELKRREMLATVLAEQTPRTVVIPALNLKKTADSALQTKIVEEKKDASTQAELTAFIQPTKAVRLLRPEPVKAAYKEAERPKRPMNFPQRILPQTTTTTTNIQNVRYYTQNNYVTYR